MLFKMDYETNREIAQDDKINAAYRVELRTAYDKRQLQLYDNLAQSANTAFAPTKTSCGLWTANSNLTCKKGGVPIEGYEGVGNGNGRNVGDDPSYCEDDTDCQSPYHCNYQTHLCTINGGGGGGGGSGPIPCQGNVICNVDGQCEETGLERGVHSACKGLCYHPNQKGNERMYHS